MKVRLIRTWSGYRPEHSDWIGFRPSVHAGIVVHDLYHHYPHETGTPEEELRSIGARLRFDSVMLTDNESLGFSIGDAGLDNRWHEANKILFKQGKASIPKIIKYMRDNLWLCGEISTGRIKFQPEQALKMLAENYDRAMKFTLKAYMKAREFDYIKEHKSEMDLMVNLNTGHIKPVEKVEDSKKVGQNFAENLLTFQKNLV